MDRDWSSHVRMSNFSTSLPIDSYHVYVYTWEVANCADPIIYTSTPNTDLFYVNTTWNLTAQFAFLGNVPRGIGLMADAVLKRYAVPLLIVPLLEYRLWCEGFWKYKEWPILSGILVVQEGFSNTVSVFHLLVLCSLFFLGALLLLLLAFFPFLPCCCSINITTVIAVTQCCSSDEYLDIGACIADILISPYMQYSCTRRFKTVVINYVNDPFLNPYGRKHNISEAAFAAVTAINQGIESEAAKLRQKYPKAKILTLDFNKEVQEYSE